MNYLNLEGLVKEGKKFSRKKWNNEGIFIQYSIASYGVQANQAAAKRWNMQKGDMLKYAENIQIKDEQGIINIYVPTVEDLCANDWYEV